MDVLIFSEITRTPIEMISMLLLYIFFQFFALLVSCGNRVEVFFFLVLHFWGPKEATFLSWTLSSGPFKSQKPKASKVLVTRTSVSVKAQTLSAAITRLVL